MEGAAKVRFLEQPSQISYSLRTQWYHCTLYHDIIVEDYCNNLKYDKIKNNRYISSRMAAPLLFYQVIKYKLKQYWCN